MEGKEGREESGEAEAGGSPCFCGRPRSSARAGSCEAPWTPRTGTPPGPRCRSCRRSRCSPAGGRRWERGERSGVGVRGREGVGVGTCQDTRLCPDVPSAQAAPGFPEGTSGPEVRLLPAPQLHPWCVSRGTWLGWAWSQEGGGSITAILLPTPAPAQRQRATS